MGEEMNINKLKDKLWDEKKRLEKRQEEVRNQLPNNISATELSSLGGSLMTISKIIDWFGG